MRLTLPALALSAVAGLALMAPAFAQDAPATAPRQPNGALVPDPAATPGTARPAEKAPAWDPGTTGTIRSRDTKGLPQSPENLNVFGCKQIDPLCQGEPRR
ncbi:MAG: hypothetical protein AB1698_14395 [Pseudomonadota bacterium]